MRAALEMFFLYRKTTFTLFLFLSHLFGIEVSILVLNPISNSGCDLLVLDTYVFGVGNVVCKCCCRMLLQLLRMDA